MSTMDATLERIWLEFKSLLERNEKDSYPFFFFDYYKGLVDRRIFDKQVSNIKYLFQLSKRPIKGSKILDVGCGFGIDCVIMAALGASEVHGMDYNESWIKTFNAYLKELKWELLITPKVGDASQLPYPDDYFDVLLSVEAISHYRDSGSFIKEANRVLKKNGVLIISDANNGSNPFIRRKNNKIWERFEHGPPADSFHGHSIKKSFFDMRKDIIADQFPQLDGNERNTLAANTFGMGRDEIVRSCEMYLQRGVFPSSKYQKGIPSFNPVMNDCIERLFAPKMLSKRIKENGFQVRLFSHFGGAGKKNIISFLNSFLRFFTPVTIYAARVFKIVAVKKPIYSE